MRIMPSNSLSTKKKTLQDCPNGSAKVLRKKLKLPGKKENGYSPYTMPAACLSYSILRIARSVKRYTKHTPTVVITMTRTTTKK